MNPNDPTRFAATQRADRDVQVIELRGELDMISAPRLAAELRDTVERGQKRIVVDLAGLDYLDSNGLSAVLQGRRAAKEAGGAFEIACPEGIVRRVFELTGLIDVLPVHAVRARAIEAIRGDARTEPLC